MPTYSMTGPDGKTYSIDGPAGATQEEVAAQMQAAHGNLAAAPRNTAPSSVVDAARSIPGGFAKGIAGIAGLPGELGNLVGVGMRAMGAPTRDTSQPLPDNVTVAYPQGDSGTITRDVGKAVGGFYEPKTTAGRYAETAASFAPALAGGEASIGQKLLGRVLAPAAGAQAAGSIVDPVAYPDLHTALQVGGAVLGGGAVGGARAISSALSHEVTPEVSANQYLVRALQNQGSSADTIAQNAISGRGQLGAEAMGPAGVGMLATLARRPGATPDALLNALTVRSSQAPSRIMDDFAAASGIHPEAAQGNIEALVDAGRTKAAPLFTAALASKAAVQSAALDELAQRPIIKKAMASAANDIRNGGGDPSAVGLHFDEAGNVTQRLDPTPEAWDLTKKALGQAVERDAFGNRLPDSKSPGNFNTSKASAQLTSALSDAVPGYGDALKASGDYLSLKAAFDAGQKHILDAKTTAAQVADHISDMSPAELEAYKGGQANQLFNKAQNARLAPRLLNTPAVQQKLAASLGPDKAKTFLTGVQQEIDLARTGGRMMPGAGSITSDILLNSGDQDNAALVEAGLSGAKAIAHGLSGNVLGATGHGLSTWSKVSALARSAGMNPEVRNELGKALMLPAQDLAARLKAMPAPANNSSALARLLSERP